MNDEKCYTVYMHTNKINGKKYIGITCRAVEDRWRNGNGYKTGKFRTAINKYGWDNFAHEIIKSCLSKKQAMDLEVMYINMYNTMDKRYGYNLIEGGDVRTGFKHTEEAKRKISLAGKNMSEETRNKYKLARSKQVITDQHRQHISESRKGMKFSDEHLKNLSESHKGNKSFWEGKERDPETKAKIRQKLGKKVICLDTGSVYDSISEASKETGIALSNIAKWCNGVKPRFLNLTFKFYEKE